jgi:hypothetical protein
VILARLAAQAPAGQSDWRPPWPESSEGKPPFTLQELILHLQDALTGPCAVLFKLHPRSLGHFEVLRNAQPGSDPEEAFQLIRAHIAEGFEITTDADLSRRISSLSHPEGQAALELFLINLGHIVSHKYQLFIYLRLLGIPLSWRDLYIT